MSQPARKSGWCPLQGSTLQHTGKGRKGKKIEVGIQINKKDGGGGGMYSSFQLHLRPASSSLSVSLPWATDCSILRIFAHATPSFSDSFLTSPFRCLASPPPWRPHLCTISQGDFGRFPHFRVLYYKGFAQNEKTWRQIELPNPCQVSDVILDRIQGDWSAKTRQSLNSLKEGGFG